MGDTIFADSATLSAVVRGAAGQTLQVIKNGLTIESVSITSDPFTHETSVEAPIEGEDRYRHQVTIGVSPQTVGSYVWLRAGEGTGTPDAGVPDAGTDPGSDSSGCDCRIVNQTDRDTAVLMLSLALVVVLLRRRRSC